MAKQKHKAEKLPIMEVETPIEKIFQDEKDSFNDFCRSQEEESAFEILDRLFHENEDNWNEIQDEKLLFLIENENGVNDKLKIKYLLKKYRNEARENNGR